MVHKFTVEMKLFFGIKNKEWANENPIETIINKKSDYLVTAFFFGDVIFALGLVLPYELMDILPFLVRLSPLPMM